VGRIRYALAAGRERNIAARPGRSGRRLRERRLGREPGVTILFIYKRLWPDPG